MVDVEGVGESRKTPAYLPGMLLVHVSLSLAGLESIFQLVHLIFTDFKWEEDALMRAKKLYAQGHDMTINSLEGRKEGASKCCQTFALIGGCRAHAWS